MWHVWFSNRENDNEIITQKSTCRAPYNFECYIMLYPDIPWCFMMSAEFSSSTNMANIDIYIYMQIYIYIYTADLLVYQFTTLPQKWLMSRSSNSRCSREGRPRLSSTGCTVLELQDRLAESVMCFSGEHTPPKFYIATAKWWLEDDPFLWVPFGMVYFQGGTASRYELKKRGYDWEMFHIIDGSSKTILHHSTYAYVHVYDSWNPCYLQHDLFWNNRYR